MKVAIFYSSVDGQTKKISEFIKKHSRDECIVDVYSIDLCPKVELSQYHFIIVGASIRYGNYRKNLFGFINSNLEILIRKKSAFFCVNIVARKSDKNSPSTNPYIKKFLRTSCWSPMLLDVFAGKLDYPNYSFLNKNVIRFIMYITKGPTDVSKTYEFTDWYKVRLFSQKILSS